MVVIDLVAHVPVAPGARLAVLDNQRVAGQQLANAAKQRRRADRVLERQIFGQRLGVGFDRRQERQQRLGFGSEDEEAADDGVIERLDAEAVAGAEEAPAPVVPDREGEHAAQPVDAIGPVAVVCGKDAFGVGIRAEPPAGRELGPQLPVIVDFAVIGDRGRPRRGHRLARRLAQIDDRQAAVGEPGLPRLCEPDAVPVGAAMGEQPAQEVELAVEPRQALPGEVDYSGNSTHGSVRNRDWIMYRR